MAQDNGQSAREWAQTNQRTMTASGGVGLAPVQPSAVSSQMNTLESRTEVLHSMISELENRLSGILMPDGPSNSAKQDMPMHSPVVLAQTLGMVNDRLDGAAARLTSILNRIEF